MSPMPRALDRDAVVGAEAEGARRATGDSAPMTASRATTPDPEVPARSERRRFTAEYRLRILTEADACKKPGDLGALLRREGLYSSLLTNWRRQRHQGALRDMRGRRRGPAPRPVDPRVKQLEAENRRLQRQLQRAETIITLKKQESTVSTSAAAWRRRSSRLAESRVSCIAARSRSSVRIRSCRCSRISDNRCGTSSRHPARRISRLVSSTTCRTKPAVCGRAYGADPVRDSQPDQHAKFGGATNTTDTTSFGRIGTQRGFMRIWQLAFRYAFEPAVVSTIATQRRRWISGAGTGRPLTAALSCVSTFRATCRRWPRQARALKAQARSIRKPLPMTTNSLISWPSTAIGRLNAPVIAPTTRMPITIVDNARFCRTTRCVRRASVSA